MSQINYIWVWWVWTVLERTPITPSRQKFELVSNTIAIAGKVLAIAIATNCVAQIVYTSYLWLLLTYLWSISLSRCLWLEVPAILWPHLLTTIHVDNLSIKNNTNGFFYFIFLCFQQSTDCKYAQYENYYFSTIN